MVPGWRLECGDDRRGGRSQEWTDGPSNISLYLYIYISIYKYYTQKMDANMLQLKIIDIPSTSSAIVYPTSH